MTDSQTRRFVFRVVPHTFMNLVISTAPGFAEGHAASTSTAHHSEFPTLLTVNFTIYLLLLFVFLRRPLARLWTERVNRIKESVERSATLLEIAQQAHAQAVETEQGLENRLAEHRRNLIASATEEAREMVEYAQERSQRMLEQANQLAGVDRDRRVDFIRREFAQQVLERAEYLIQQRLSEESDKRIRSTALSNSEALALLT